ncbi:hypothetical protein TNCV_620411 [Trichonephila clavipes]|nr:hypothetical protein TNCV_620411 [Trichonephila clavipes]
MKVMFEESCLSCQANKLDAVSDEVQELLDSLSQELTMDELVEIHEMVLRNVKEQDSKLAKFFLSIRTVILSSNFYHLEQCDLKTWVVKEVGFDLSV